MVGNRSMTPRQRSVADHVMLGESTKEIANTLHLSPCTIKVYLSQLFLIWQVSNRTALAVRLCGVERY